jgi:SAM-dependent methyltransferase
MTVVIKSGMRDGIERLEEDRNLAAEVPGLAGTVPTAERPTPAPVDLYGTAYGNFATDVLGQVRRDTYGEDFGQSSWVTGPEYRRFCRLLGLAAAEHVLDVGCGSGGPALFLARAIGCRVTGVDVNEAGIQAGRALTVQAGLDGEVRFRRADVREPLPFTDGMFDAIVCMDAMCHLPGRGRLLGEWRRVLRPGGRLLYTDPVVVTGPVSNEELAMRSSTGYFEFCPPGVNERLIGQAGFQLMRAEDVTGNEVEVSHRWHAAREQRAAALIRLEGEATFTGLQRFLATVHRLTSERRLSRFAYLGRKPGA